MNMVVNPSIEHIRGFCKIMEQRLLAAADRGSFVEIGFKVHTEEVFDRLRYGMMPVDLRYVGETFKATFKEQ